MSKRVGPAYRWLGALTIFYRLYLPAALAQGKWVDLAPFPEPHEEVSGQATNGKMYPFAGPPLSKMPMARSGLCAGVHNGRVYVAGHEGQNAVEQNAYRAFEAYDPATNSWSVLPPMTHE